MLDASVWCRHAVATRVDLLGSRGYLRRALVSLKLDFLGVQ